MGNCIVCGWKLDKWQQKYCSKSCENKLWRTKNREKNLASKKRYREAHREQIATYSKAYKAAVPKLKESIAIKLKRQFNCLRCDTKNKLEVHHIKHQNYGGGSNDLNNLVVLCKSCHALWHKIFDATYWQRNEVIAALELADDLGTSKNAIGVDVDLTDVDLPDEQQIWYKPYRA